MARALRIVMVALIIVTSLVIRLNASAQALRVDVCEARSESIDKIIEACTRAIHSSRLSVIDRVNAFLIRGNAWQGKGDFDRAIDDYNEAIRFAPQAPVLFNNRGNAWQRKEDYDRALADYNNAIRLRPKYATAFNNRGDVWLRTGKYDLAVADYDEAIRLDPKYANPYANRGFIHYFRKSFAKATQDFSAALKLDPSNAYIAIWLSLADARTSGSPKVLGRANVATSSEAWPAPGLRFLRGEISQKQLMAATVSDDPVVQGQRRCEAIFYVSQWHLIQGRATQAEAGLRDAQVQCPSSFVEYHAALAELQQPR